MILNGKTVFISGSGRGIGKSIAFDLARNGYSVVLHGRTGSDHLDSACKELCENGFTARQLAFDVSDRNIARSVLEQDIRVHGMYYGIVLNAGIYRDNAFPFMGGDDWDAVLSTNLNGFYNILNPLVEPLILTRRGGRIIVMTSVSGIMGNRGQVNYSASKAGLIGASRALALELARKKITVNCVAPGLIESDMTSGALIERISVNIPMRRVGQAEEVAGVVSFLMSDKASYITRQTISVDGGLT